MTNKNDSHANESQKDFADLNLTLDKVILDQLKNIYKKEYLEKIKNLDDGEVLSFLLDEVAFANASSVCLKNEVEDLKKTIIEISKLQEKIHKFYRDNFEKLNNKPKWRSLF